MPRMLTKLLFHCGVSCHHFDNEILPAVARLQQFRRTEFRTRPAQRSAKHGSRAIFGARKALTLLVEPALKHQDRP